MISNPIVRKEVLSSLRTRKAVFMQAAFLLAVAGLIWLLWPAGGLQDYRGDQARRIFAVLSIGEMVLVALFAPAFTAAALTGEKERNTWESLYATSMKPWEIALGKMVGSLTFLILLVLTGSVGLAMPLLLGGVRAVDVLAAMGLLLLTAVYLGMIGLLVSTVSHRSYRAIIITYGILLAVCILVAIPAWPISNRLMTRLGGGGQAVLHYLASLSPIQAMLSLVLGKGEYTTPAADQPAFWVTYIPLALLAITALMITCLYKLHRPVAPPRPREKLKVVERGKVNARSILFIIDPRKRKRSISWWQNPVLVKEFRTRPMLQAHTLLRIIGTCMIVSVLLMFVVSLGVSAFVGESAGMVENMLTVVAALSVVLVCLVGPAMTSGAICADRETGGWDLLRTTRLPSWRIVSGKFQAAVIPLVLLALAIAPSAAILLYFNVNIWRNIVGVMEVLGVTILFVAACGLFFSSFFSRTPTATAWTYAVILTMGFLSLLMLLARDLFSRRLVRTVFLANPVAAAMDAAGHVGMQELALVDGYVRLVVTVSILLLVITVLRVLQLRRADK